MLSLDTSYEREPPDDGIWFVDGKEIRVYLLGLDWDDAQGDTSSYETIDRNVLYGILRSYDARTVSFTYTDPAIIRIDFRDGGMEIFNIGLHELNDFVNEFVEFPLPDWMWNRDSGDKVNWKKEGF